jgi:DNA-binding CsgD family transcriptional regulator
LRAWRQSTELLHRVALVPPGLVSQQLFGHVLASLASDFTIISSNAISGAMETEVSAPVLIIVSSEPEPASAQTLGELLANPLTEPVHWIAEYPFWFDAPVPAGQVEVSLDSRFFRYLDAELQQLLENSEIGDEQLDWLTTHDIRTMSGAWPGITDAALQEIAAQQLQPSQDLAGGPAQYSVAQFSAVRDYFAGHWLPLLQWRYPWFRELCVLPLITLDLLAAVFSDVSDAIKECFLSGWLERCPGSVGEYRPDTTLDQLMRALQEPSSDSARIEKAISWYQQHGYPAEAIESAAILGAPLEKMQQLMLEVPAQVKRPRGASGYLRPDSGSATGSVVARAGAGVTSAGLAAKLSSAVGERLQQLSVQETPDGSTPGAAEPDLPAQSMAAVDHILQAISLHQGYNWTGVSDAIKAAVNNGFERQQISRLVDFVDVHMRPLLRQGGTPLSRAIHGLKHTGPAKASVTRIGEKLNYRELQILQSICDGYKNQEISEQLGLKLSTVKWYGTRIYEKLEVSNRTQAAAKARKLKLVD